MNGGRRRGVSVNAIAGLFTLAPRLPVAVFVPGLAGGENGFQSEVIALTDRVVFVMMAIRATDRKAEHGFAERHDLIGSPDVFQHFRKRVEGVLPLTQRPDRHRVLHGFRLFGPELIAGHLFHEKTVVGLVFVETANHVIAVAPGLLVVDVRLIAAGVRVAHQVQPMPCPALAIGWRGQEPVDDISVSFRARVADEGPDLVRGRGQSGQVEGDAPQQSFLRRRRCGVQLFLVEAGENKGVDWGVRPSRVAGARHGGPD